MMMFLFSIFSACSERDTLAGSWAGDVSCKDQDFVLDIALNEVRPFEYDGQFLFRYSRSVSNGIFYANLLYDVQAIQPAKAGAQEIPFYNVIWSELGCKTEFDDGTEQAGGCQSNGLDTADLEEDIGDVYMDFNGIDRLVIDDGNCQGAIYRE